MAKSKDELQRQLATFQADVTKYQKKMNECLAAGNKKKASDYAMAVAGLKNSIKELQAVLDRM